MEKEQSKQNKQNKTKNKVSDLLILEELKEKYLLPRDATLNDIKRKK